MGPYREQPKNMITKHSLDINEVQEAIFDFLVKKNKDHPATSKDFTRLAWAKINSTDPKHGWDHIEITFIQKE